MSLASLGQATVSVVFDGAGTLDVPADTPLAVTYDSRRPYTDRFNAFNRGCPHGYVAVYRGNAPVCRLATSDFMGDPSIEAREAQLSWAEWALQVVGGAILDTAAYIGRGFERGATGLLELPVYLASVAGRTAAAALKPVVPSLTTLLWPVALIVGGLWAVGQAAAGRRR
jgi:hypothetical protein